MKKILSVLLVLCMLLSSCLVFSACGKVTEKKAAKDPFEIIATAWDTSLSSFFSDTKEIGEIDKEAGKMGSYQLILASDELDNGKLYEIDETLYMDHKGGALVSETKLTVAGTSYRASIWGDRESLALKSEAILGSKDTLMINFKQFLEKFEDSELKTALNLDEETTAQLLKSVEYLTKCFDEKNPPIPEEDVEKLTDDLCKILNQKIVEKEIAVGDEKKSKHIVISYSLDNDGWAELIDFYIGMIADYDIPVGDSVTEPEETLTEFLRKLNEDGTLNISCDFAIHAKSGALSQMDVDMSFRPKTTADGEETAENRVDIALSLAFTEDLLTLTGTFEAAGEEYKVEAEIEKTVKSDKTTYTFTAEAKTGNVRIDLLDATYTYDVKDGEIELEGFLALNEDDRATFDLKATCEVIKKKSYTVTVDTFKLSSNGENLLDFKKSRNNELSFSVSVIDELPERDEDAMDIVDMDQKDIEKLLTDMENSSLSQLIGGLFGYDAEDVPDFEAW